MKISLVTKAWPYHGAHSGYEQIANWITEAKIIRPIITPYRVSSFIGKKTNRKNYTSDSVQKEIGAIFSCLLYQPDIIHFLYAGHDLHYFGKFNSLYPKTKIVATFHQPQSELITRWENCDKRFLKPIDLAICMGRNQISFIQQYIKGRAVWIPHGIDTEFFKPNPMIKRDNYHIAIIGVSHRDTNTLFYVLSSLKVTFPDIKVTLVVKNAQESILGTLSWVDFKGFINDEDLLMLYQKATCVLLLLNECTASNTLLETLSTGCPLIVTKVEGVMDYLGKDDAIYIKKGDVEDTIEKVTEFLRNHSHGYFPQGYHKVQEYNWINIAQQTKTLYQSLLKK